MYMPSMAALRRMVTVLVLCCAWLPGARSHGRLIEPASRNSMWRFKYPNPRNYNDMGLNCGGFPNQFEKQGGRCGVCGDPYQGPWRHEAGGKYARGIIARQYRMGALINVTVTLTSNHKGYFEFRLCPVNDPRKRASQACMDRNQLNIIGHGSRYFIRDRQSRIDLEMLVMLPPRLKCTQCVLQWKYVAGQSMGPDGRGGECLGCGNQENFVNCADIAIGNHAVTPLPTTPPPPASSRPVQPPSVPASHGDNSRAYGSNIANSIRGKSVSAVATKPWYEKPSAAYNPVMGHNSPVPVHNNYQPATKPSSNWQSPNNMNPSLSQNMPQFMMDNYDWITAAPPTGHVPNYEQSHSQNYNSLTEQQQEDMNEYYEAQEAGEIPKTSPPQWERNSIPKTSPPQWARNSIPKTSPPQWVRNSIPKRHINAPISDSNNGNDPGYMKGYNDAIRALQSKLGLSGQRLIGNMIIESRKQKAIAGGRRSCASPVCKGINSAAGDPEYDTWCTESCRNPATCPADMCSCNCAENAPLSSGKVCRGVDRSKGEAMDSWCHINCKGNHCPSHLCICS